MYKIWTYFLQYCRMDCIGYTPRSPTTEAFNESILEVRAVHSYSSKAAELGRMSTISIENMINIIHLFGIVKLHLSLKQRGRQQNGFICDFTNTLWLWINISFLANSITLITQTFFSLYCEKKELEDGNICLQNPECEVKTISMVGLSQSRREL